MSIGRGDWDEMNMRRREWVGTRERMGMEMEMEMEMGHG